MQGATPKPRRKRKAPDEISIHAPYAGGDRMIIPICVGIEQISIHAPYAGGDSAMYQTAVDAEISIHAPYAGGDH